LRKDYKNTRKTRSGEDWPAMKPIVADDIKKMKCGVCRKTSKVGEVFLATNKRDFGWIGFHKKCLIDMAQHSEMQDYDDLKKRLLNGEAIF
jgi:hypothetical protein